MRPLRRASAITRRAFLGDLAGAAGVAVAWASEAHSMAARPFPDTPGARRLGRIGIQLYTVRSVMAHDADGTLGALAAIGYTEVELAGLYGMQATAMRQLLDHHGLEAVSGHLSLRDMRRDWPRALADAATVGQHYIVCADIDQSEWTADGFRRAADDLNRFAESARQHRLQLAYHNHMYEFTPVSGIVPYEILLTRCDSHLVQMEVDIMWMTKAGGDPVSYFDRYPGRFPMVHVKDMTKAGVMVDVGRGSIDFRRIFAQSDRAGIKHYFVEHDDPPSPVADARVCYDYLRALTF
jgi:sugar phosphate isomerase/epimerase